MEREDTYRSSHRRVRANRHIRELAADVSLSHRDLIQPLFLDESLSQQTPVPNLNEVNSETVDTLIKQVESDLRQGIQKFLVFPIPKAKKASGFDYSFFTNSLERIRKEFGDAIWIAADVCLCAYTTHGHCGILNKANDRVLNSETVQELTAYSVQLAQAGADCIAPSDMMDGRVASIRSGLNAADFDHTAIMSYSAKFSSQFYGPFRDACKSTPAQGLLLKDRKTYQISPSNLKDAIQSALRDSREGADIIMVKPALPYLDIVHYLKTAMNRPLAAFHVSGEYQSIELLAQHGIIERNKAHLEVWTSLKRAGANMIITYAARCAKKWIEDVEY